MEYSGYLELLLLNKNEYELKFNIIWSNSYDIVGCIL